MSARSRLGLLSLVLLICAACATSASPTPLPTGAAGTPVVTAAQTHAGATATPVAGTVTPRPAPSATATGPSAAPSSDADVCSGLADNKSFFANLAAEVKWAVYCAVLPAGWYVYPGGHFELGGGGWMTISYRGPGGVSLQLKEGAYCSDTEDVCQPQVEAVGPTLYGDLTGTLYTLQPGYAVYVNDPTKPPSWAAATVDLEESTFVRLVASLHHVLP